MSGDIQGIRRALVALRGSVENGCILSGDISGVEYMETIGEIAAIVNYGGCRVYIPAGAFADIAAPTGRDPLAYTRNALARRLGGTVDFIACAVDGLGRFAVADRMAAMARRRHDGYTEPRWDGLPKLRVGTEAEARIVLVCKSGMLLEISGVEVFVRCDELSFQRIADARERWHPGGLIRAKLMQIEILEDGDVHVTASVKQCGTDPALSEANKYNKGGLYAGEVSLITRHGIFVALEGIDCLCKLPPKGSPPPRGARVSVKLTDNAEGKLYGVITRAI